MLRLKKTQRNCSGGASAVLRSFEAHSERNALEEELTRLMNMGYRWAGQRIWFYSEAHSGAFENNDWQMGDLPYAEWIAAVMIRLARPDSETTVSFYFERELCLEWACCSGDDSSSAYPPATFAGRTEALGVVTVGDCRTNLEACGLPIALKGPEYPMLIWEPLLAACGLLSEEDRRAFHNYVNQNARPEYDWSDEYSEETETQIPSARLDAFDAIADLPPCPDGAPDEEPECEEAIVERRLELGLNEDGSERDSEKDWEVEVEWEADEDSEEEWEVDEADLIPPTWDMPDLQDAPERLSVSQASVLRDRDAAEYRVRQILDELGDAGYQYFGETVTAKREKFYDLLDCLGQRHRMPYFIRSTEMAFLDAAEENVVLLYVQAKQGLLRFRWDGLDHPISVDEYLSRVREKRQGAYEMNSLQGSLNFREEDPLSCFVDPPLPGETFLAVYPEPVLDDLLFEYGLTKEV